MTDDSNPYYYIQEKKKEEEEEESFRPFYDAILFLTYHQILPIIQIQYK